MNPQNRLESDLSSQAPQAARSDWRKLAKHLLRTVLLLATLIFVGKELWQRLSIIEWDRVKVSWTLVCLALCMSTLGSALPLVSSRFILQSFSSVIPPWLPLASASWIPALGKYVPGKIATFLFGVWMLRALRVPPTSAVLTSFLLNGLAVAVGMILAVPLMFWEPIHERMPWAGPLCVVLVIFGMICLHPRIVGGIGTFCLRRLKIRSEKFVPKWNDHAVPLMVLVVQFCAQGIALWLLVNAFQTISLNWLPAFISINALAVSIGFLALFAPGGIGVREGILLLVLTPATSDAALIVVGMRVVSIFGELILATLGAAILCSPIWKAACLMSAEKHEGQAVDASSTESPVAPATDDVVRAA